MSKKRGIAFDLVRREDELAELVKQTEDPEFWNDPDAAQAHMQRITTVRATIEPWQELRHTVEDLATLAELGLEEEDESVAAEIAEGLRRARLMKHRSLPENRTAQFRLTSRGLE